MFRVSGSRSTWALVVAFAIAAVICLFYWAFTRLAPSKTPGGPPFISSTDPRMKAAVAEARQRYPEFYALWRDKTPGNSAQRFFVKADFPTGGFGGSEPIWVMVDFITDNGNTLTGTVDSNPVKVRNVRLGDTVIVKRENVSDWIYESPGERRGDFTGKLLESLEKRGPATTAPSTTAPATQPGGERT